MSRVARSSSNTHPHASELFTPVTDELVRYLDDARQVAGTWRAICERGGIKLRVLRRLRRQETKTCSMDLMDRVIVGSGHGSLNDWLWFEADDLIKLGIWEEPVRVEGKKRIQGDKVWSKDDTSPRERELEALRRKTKRRSAARRKRLRLEKEHWKRLLG